MAAEELLQQPHAALEEVRVLRVNMERLNEEFQRWLTETDMENGNWRGGIDMLRASVAMPRHEI